MGKSDSARGASMRGEGTTNRGKSSTLVSRDSHHQSIESSVNKNSNIMKESKATVKGSKPKGARSTKSDPTPSFSKTTEVDGDDGGLGLIEREMEQALKGIDGNEGTEQVKRFILGGCSSKRCFEVIMTRAVMKKLIRAKEKGAAMKLKISDNIEISLGGKNKISFSKNVPDRMSTILALNGDDMEVVGDVTQQVISTKETNHDARLECLIPDPEVSKQKRPKLKKKDKDSTTKIVTYIGPGEPPPRFSIGNDDDPGVPLKKRVIHLVALEELNTEQIASRVQDNVQNVQKILNETASLKGDAWKLKTETLLTLEPYNFAMYDTSKINKVVSMMNDAADKLGYPQDSPVRPRPPKQIALNKHQNPAPIESNVPSKRPRIETSPSSSTSKSVTQPASNRGGKTTVHVNNGGKTKGRGSKTSNANNTLSAQPSTEVSDDILDPAAKANNTVRGGHASRGGKSTRPRGVKTITDQSAGHANQTNTSTRGRRGRPVGSKNSTSRKIKTTSQKTTAPSREVTTIRAMTTSAVNVSGELPPVKKSSNVSKRSPRHVETMSEFRELLNRFNEKLKAYYELDARLERHVEAANEIQADIHNPHLSVNNERIMEKFKNLFDEGTEVYKEIEMFNSLEEELKMMVEEGIRAAKEGVYDDSYYLSAASVTNGSTVLPPGELYFSKFSENIGFLYTAAEPDSGDIQWYLYTMPTALNDRRITLQRSGAMQNTGGDRVKYVAFPTSSGDYCLVVARSYNLIKSFNSSQALSVDVTLEEHLKIYANFIYSSESGNVVPILLYTSPVQDLDFFAMNCGVEAVDTLVTNTLSFNITSTDYLYLATVHRPRTVGQNVYGYILNATGNLVDEWSLPQPFRVNSTGDLYGVQPNNSIVYAQQFNASSWSLSSANIPDISMFNDSGYFNPQIISTYPPIDSSIPLRVNSINITYKQPVSFSTGNIDIFQLSGSYGESLLRQAYSASSIYCNQTADFTTITCQVLNSTFNKPDTTYYVVIESDFVRLNSTSEPLLGVRKLVWKFTTNEITPEEVDVATRSIVRLSPLGTGIFENLTHSEKDDEIGVPREGIKRDNDGFGKGDQPYIIFDTSNIDKNDVTKDTSGGPAIMKSSTIS
ncbi:7292_t:CDS:10 [Acaulospora colombiana]|uniref:7292_t:CDS:1 n=1 Tax=Acaulospora colombiana TaxID=27376 RepID=A0ACA9K9X4_9GLOM|nr:7292_t:CDS:10 [Acaulospora colombiana]